MFLVEEKTNGNSSAAIYMRDDGLFEGRIYRTDGKQSKAGSDCGFEVCGVTETLPRIESIIDEELDL